MRNIVAAGFLAFCVAMTSGAGISNADQIPVGGSHETQTACLNEGTAHVPSVYLGRALTSIPFTCEQHNDGLWYLYLVG